MKKSILILFFSIVSISAWSQYYNLVFNDDFSGSSLDLSKWNIHDGVAANQEKQYYTPGNANIRVEGGNLIITAKKENYIAERDYSSGRLNSKGKGFINRGKAEARISLPAGAGTWPAFWMMPEVNVYGGWPNSGEIDIMEHVGSNPTMISHAVHTYYYNGAVGTNWKNEQTVSGVENNFHTYSLTWTEEYMRFYIDGVLSTTLWRNLTQDYKYWPFDHDFYVILNLALGGTMGGTINDAIFSDPVGSPVEMKIDYVKLWQEEYGVGVNATGNDNLIEVYPTQFSNEINIKTENPIKIQLYNIAGKVVLEKNIAESEQLATTNLPSGLYLLKAENKTFKLIK